MRLALILTLIVGCQKFGQQKDTTDNSNLMSLSYKAELYRDMAKTVLDDDGWIMTDECDALLHSSLANIGGVVSYDDLFRARDSDGKWWRRPGRDCLSSGGSKSTISRDMLLGILLSIMYKNDLEAAELLVNYGEEHNWVMGDSDGSLDGKNRVIATPALQSLIYQVRHKLGGASHAKEAIPQDYTPFKKGFERHLVALTILLRAKIKGTISNIELNTIRSYAEGDPNNALFLSIRDKFDPDNNGDQSAAISMLLNDRYFPSDRLPEASDRCAPYLWMHGEKPKDWEPCTDESKVHPGHDLLLVSAIVFDSGFGLSVR